MQPTSRAAALAGADDAAARGAAARRLIRRRGHAALATLLDGRPYVSLVACACDGDASPLLLLSDLARHTGNIAGDARVSLLFEEQGGGGDPLAAARLTLLGRAERSGDPRLAARFAARHPESASYAAFADFHLYRIVVERGHLVAGFGRIAWVEAADLRVAGDASALEAAEAAVVAEINDAHADAIARHAARLLGRDAGAGWRLTGIDPEGADLRLPDATGEATARLDFASPALTPEAARAALLQGPPPAPPTR